MGYPIRISYTKADQAYMWERWQTASYSMRLVGTLGAGVRQCSGSCRVQAVLGSDGACREQSEQFSG